MIVQLVTRLAMGGAQEIVLRVSEDLNQKNIKNVIITGTSNKNSLSAPDNTLLNKAINNNLNVDIVNNLSDRINLYKDFLAILNIYKVLKKYQPKIVHIHSSKTGLLGRILKIFFRKTHFIYHVHGWSYSRYAGFKRKIFFCLEYFLYYFTDSYIFVCKHDLNEFIQMGGPKKITKISEIIYPGVNFLQPHEISHHRDKIRNSYSIKNNEYLVGNIARVDHQKDPILFIQMAAYLKKTSRQTKYKFMWIGDGSLMNECKSLVKKLGLENDFIFTGYIENVNTYFGIFDIFVISSAYEGLPVTAIKALGSGVPLSSVAINGLNDLNLYKGVNLTYNRSPIELAKCVRESKIKKYNQYDINVIKEIFSNKEMLKNIRKNYEKRSR
jgi:glycosyltransferase involved in cell wall biosynthesis